LYMCVVSCVFCTCVLYLVSFVHVCCILCLLLYPVWSISYVCVVPCLFCFTLVLFRDYFVLRLFCTVLILFYACVVSCYFCIFFVLSTLPIVILKDDLLLVGRGI